LRTTKKKIKEILRKYNKKIISVCLLNKKKSTKTNKFSAFFSANFYANFLINYLRKKGIFFGY
jgi:hypothetical protein